MEIQTITYDNKTALNVNADIPNINKVTDNNMNEIKSVVNNNANVLGNIATALENIVSTIIESGSNSNGSYIKFADGTMICYKEIQVTSNITNSWGNLYESASAVSNSNVSLNVGIIGIGKWK